MSYVMVCLSLKNTIVATLVGIVSPKGEAFFPAQPLTKEFCALQEVGRAHKVLIDVAGRAVTVYNLYLWAGA
eukprot:12982245-Alexandrium_andersonii.AAC.1